MYIEWYDLKDLDEIVNSIINVLNKRNISIYGDFIKSDYVYDYKYDTATENFLMKREKYNELVSSKKIPYYSEDDYAGIRDFKGSMLYSQNDNDLDNSIRKKLVITFMIVAVAHDVYDGELYRFSKVFKSAYDFIKHYGYSLNWRYSCCFPFDIKSAYKSDEIKVVFLEETIIEAICKYTMFAACGKRRVKYFDKELVMKYLTCDKYEIDRYLNMFRAGYEYANGESVTDEMIYKYMIEKNGLFEKYQK